MSKNINTLFTLLCLFATSVVTIATSKKGDHPDAIISEHKYNGSLIEKNYFVASNCPQSIAQEKITVVSERILRPANTNFSDFGIPAESINLTFTNQINHPINGQMRSCLRSEQVEQGTSLIVYTCSENGTLICQITFEVTQ